MSHQSMHISFAAALIMAACVVPRETHATPLSLSYCVEATPSGNFKYTFTLTLTNADATWQPGQTFNWIVFGDVLLGESPLADFSGIDPLPVPWADEGFNYSTGTHNGPTLLDFGRSMSFYGWQPFQIGDSRTWEGYSAAYVPAGQLLWSNLMGTGERATQEPAVFINCGPQLCQIADFNQDGSVEGQDIEAFYTSWEVSEPAADVNLDGGVDGQDIEVFFTYWEVGGC